MRYCHFCHRFIREKNVCAHILSERKPKRRKGNKMKCENKCSLDCANCIRNKFNNGGYFNSSGTG
jgi:hypothetical protein